MLVMILNALIDLLVAIFSHLFNFLPNTPFQFNQIDWGVFGQAVGLIFPLGDMATHFVLILTALGTYYSVRWMLRLIKQIQ